MLREKRARTHEPVKHDDKMHLKGAANQQRRQRSIIADQQK
jgi:hypothetical protein